MRNLKFKNFIILMLHAFVIWILCGATIGRQITSMENVLIIHVILAPIFAILISSFYYKKFNFTTPLTTAIIFTLFIIVLDAGIVAPLKERSFDMFKSIIGTWIPFALIFIGTSISGTFISKQISKDKKL